MLAKDLHVDNPNYRPAESFEHAIRVQRPFGWVDTAIKWCREEMQGEWRWQLVSVSTDYAPGEYIFYFDSDRDYCAFCLKYQ